MDAIIKQTEELIADIRADQLAIRANFQAGKTSKMMSERILNNMDWLINDLISDLEKGRLKAKIGS